MRVLEGLNKSRLAWAFDLPIERLEEIAREPTEHYRRFMLNEGDKSRPIAAPTGAFKKGLRRFLKKELRTVPVHACAACAPTRGVLWAARQHRYRPYLLQLDLKDFFPSVTAERVVETLEWHGCPGETSALLASLLLFEGELPQGSPTSVTVGNLVLHRLDSRIRKGFDRGIAYTRYVDDISLSGGERVRDIVAPRVKEWIEDEGWTVHPDKGGCFGPEEAQDMLGLLVNVEVNLSSKYVRDVRAALRAVVRGEVHPSAEELRSLEGKVTWLEQVRPETSIGRLYQDAVEAAKTGRRTA